MYYIYKKKDSHLKVYCGEVTSISDKLIGDAKVDTCIIKLKDYKGEEKSFFFKDTEENQRATSVRKLNLHIGSYVMVLGVCEDESKDTATGIRASFKGCFEFKSESGKAINVCIGTACNVKYDEEKGRTSFSFPLCERTEDDRYEDTWYTVSFYDNEDKKTATKVKGLLSGDGNSTVCFVAGEKVQKTYNDRLYHYLNGYELTKKPEKSE